MGILKLEREGLVLNSEILSSIHDSKSEMGRETPRLTDDEKREQEIDRWKKAVLFTKDLEAKISKAGSIIVSLKASLVQVEEKLGEALSENRKVKLERDKALKQCKKYRERNDELETEISNHKENIRQLEERSQSYSPSKGRRKLGKSKGGFENEDVDD